MSEITRETAGYITPSLIFLGVALHQAVRILHVLAGNLSSWKSRFYLICVSGLVTNIMSVLMSIVILDNTVAAYAVPDTIQGQTWLWRMIFNYITTVIVMLMVMYRIEELYERKMYYIMVGGVSAVILIRSFNCLFGFIGFGAYAFGMAFGNLQESSAYSVQNPNSELSDVACTRQPL